MADPKATPVTDTGGWQYGNVYSAMLLGSGVKPVTVTGTLVGIDGATQATGLWLRDKGEPGAAPFYVGLGAGMVVRDQGEDPSYRDPFAVEAPL